MFSQKKKKNQFINKNNFFIRFKGKECSVDVDKNRKNSLSSVFQYRNIYKIYINKYNIHDVIIDLSLSTCLNREKTTYINTKFAPTIFS